MPAQLCLDLCVLYCECVCINQSSGAIIIEQVLTNKLNKY